jgi:hypothetical protein
LIDGVCIKLLTRLRHNQAPYAPGGPETAGAHRGAGSRPRWRSGSGRHGADPRGRGAREIRGSTPRKADCPCTSAGGVERGQGAGTSAGQPLCRAMLTRNTRRPGTQQADHAASRRLTRPENLRLTSRRESRCRRTTYAMISGGPKMAQLPWRSAPDAH